MNRIKVGLIGFGRMGGFYLSEMQNSGEWNIAYICDISEESLALAQTLSPESKLLSDSQEIFDDPEVQVIVLSALANSRKENIRKAIETGKHIISEKPIADTMENEWEVVRMTEESNIYSTVNLYLRNSWYHNTIKEFIATGEIGELAIIRICHMTPGLAPGEGHEFEGPSFHDCGMHYVDITRWYAESEFKTWNAQAVRMWDYKDPWWLQVHGTFENGVIFDITQGHVYGQLSKDQSHNSYIDIIGTKGIARMSHDFKTAVVELHGVTRTKKIEKPYGDKNIGKLCQLLVKSIREKKRDKLLPTLRDSATASRYSWKFLNNATKNDLPSTGDNETLEEILERRRNMTEGYGLINSRKATN